MSGVAWLALARTPRLAPRVACEAARLAGGAARLLEESVRGREAAGVPAQAARALDAALVRAERESLAVAECGGSVLGFDAAAYPERLRALPDPPLALAVAGQAERLAGPAVAVVGARRASAYGRRIAEEIGRDLAAAGVLVVSGLAAGVDAAAHRGALAAPGATAAVMATGIDRVYPAWHADLADAIRDRGVLVTEFPPGTPARPENFHRRNRIVSGLAVGVVVVEAAPRSGSLMTARLALDQNRVVMAVPGAVGPALHEGPNGLIRGGAALVRSAHDVLEDLLPQMVPRLAAAAEARARADLTMVETRVVDALRHEARQLEDLINTTGFGPDVLAETLLALELRGLVEQTAGKRFRRRAA